MPTTGPMLLIINFPGEHSVGTFHCGLERVNVLQTPQWGLGSLSLGEGCRCIRAQVRIFFSSLFMSLFSVKSPKLQVVSTKFSDNAINFIKKMKPYGAINSKSGTK